jgi:hypothetical protein
MVFIKLDSLSGTVRHIVADRVIPGGWQSQSDKITDHAVVMGCKIAQGLCNRLDRLRAGATAA